MISANIVRVELDDSYIGYLVVRTESGREIRYQLSPPYVSPDPNPPKTMNERQRS